MVNLIGISGKIGSGKDTVGKIIQHVILSSKYNNFHEFDPTVEHTDSGWEIKKLAYKVKQVLSLLTGIPVEDFEKEEVKSSYLGDEWKVKWLHSELGPLATIDSDNEYRHIPFEKLKVRKALQLVGTDLFRDRFHPNTFCTALFTDYNPKVNSDFLKMSLKEATERGLIDLD